MVRKFARYTAQIASQMRTRHPDFMPAKLVEITPEDNGVVELADGARITVPFPPAGASQIGVGTKGKLSFENGNLQRPFWRTCSCFAKRRSAGRALEWAMAFANSILSRAVSLLGEDVASDLSGDPISLASGATKFLRSTEDNLYFSAGTTIRSLSLEGETETREVGASGLEGLSLLGGGALELYLHGETSLSKNSWGAGEALGETWTAELGGENAQALPQAVEHENKLLWPFVDGAGSAQPVEIGGGTLKVRLLDRATGEQTGELSLPLAEDPISDENTLLHGAPVPQRMLQDVREVSQTSPSFEQDLPIRAGDDFASIGRCRGLIKTATGLIPAECYVDQIRCVSPEDGEAVWTHNGWRDWDEDTPLGSNSFLEKLSVVGVDGDLALVFWCRLRYTRVSGINFSGSNTVIPIQVNGRQNRLYIREEFLADLRAGGDTGLGPQGRFTGGLYITAEEEVPLDPPDSAPNSTAADNVRETHIAPVYNASKAANSLSGTFPETQPRFALTGVRYGYRTLNTETGDIVTDGGPLEPPFRDGSRVGAEDSEKVDVENNGSWQTWEVVLVPSASGWESSSGSFDPPGGIPAGKQVVFGYVGRFFEGTFDWPNNKTFVRSMHGPVGPFQYPGGGFFIDGYHYGTPGSWHEDVTLNTGTPIQRVGMYTGTFEALPSSLLGGAAREDIIVLTSPEGIYIRAPIYWDTQTVHISAYIADATELPLEIQPVPRWDAVGAALHNGQAVFGPAERNLGIEPTGGYGS